LLDITYRNYGSGYKGQEGKEMPRRKRYTHTGHEARRRMRHVWYQMMDNS